ncbi:hypothetical protein GGI35DRAFT_46909 [Trichoderma velutinum]
MGRELMYLLVRRVKCDEATPFCHPCISTGRKCDGYGPNVEAPPSFPVSLLGAPSRPPTVDFPGTEHERRSFYFFRQKTAPQLAAFLKDEVWERPILQAALHEPSIRHAILALGSLHAKFEQNDGLIMQSHTNKWIDVFAMKNYSQAIDMIVKSLSQKGQPAIDVCLICSILFACFEAVQSNYGPAITHVQSGLKILCEIKYNEETRRYQHDVISISNLAYISIKILQDMFMRLDLQVIQMVRGEKWETHDSMKEYAPKTEIPAILSTLSNVGKSLVTQWHMDSYSTSDVWDPISGKSSAAPQIEAWQQKSRSMLARWSSAYDVYLNIRGGNLTNEKRKGAAGLRILKELGSLAAMLMQTKVDDERNWDIFCPIFQNVVSLTEDIVELDSKLPAERNPYCIDMALIGPLFQISCRCRNPIIRRRAISILRTCGRIEGVWDAFSTSQVAQRVLEIEEAGLQSVRRCEDIPSWARISNVVPVFDPAGRRATLTYNRLDNEYSKTILSKVDIIEW